jgi:hypothetical protein
MQVQRVGVNSFVQTMRSAFVQQWSFGSFIDLYYSKCLVQCNSEYYGRGCFDSACCCCCCVCSGLLLSRCMFPLLRQAYRLQCIGITLVLRNELVFISVDVQMYV